MDKRSVKNIAKWTIIILVILIFVSILMSVFKKIKRFKDTVYNVTAVKLVKIKIPHILTFQGIIEGDPQVKIYSQVPGKFVKNVVAEGDLVSKDQVVSYIDRDMVGFRYELAPVKASISGIVTKLYYIDKGDSVNPQMPVAEIANEDNIKVVINVGQSDLLKIRKGQEAEIYFINEPAISVKGQVYSVPPVVDKDIMAGTVVIKAENKARTLKIGMSANVEINLEESETYVVPERAVLFGEDYAFVFVNDNGIAKQTKITQGFKYKNLVEINGPFKDGDEVIVDGNFKIYDGAKIKTNIIELN